MVNSLGIPFTLNSGFFGAYKFINSDKAKTTAIRHFYLVCYRLLGVKYDELTSLNNELQDK